MNKGDLVEIKCNNCNSKKGKVHSVNNNIVMCLSCFGTDVTHYIQGNPASTFNPGNANYVGANPTSGTINTPNSNQIKPRNYNDPIDDTWKGNTRDTSKDYDWHYFDTIPGKDSSSLPFHISYRELAILQSSLTRYEFVKAIYDNKIAEIKEILSNYVILEETIEALKEDYSKITYPKPEPEFITNPVATDKGWYEEFTVKPSKIIEVVDEDCPQGGSFFMNSKTITNPVTGRKSRNLW